MAMRNHFIILKLCTNLRIRILNTYFLFQLNLSGFQTITLPIEKITIHTAKTWWLLECQKVKFAMPKWAVSIFNDWPRVSLTFWYFAFCQVYFHLGSYEDALSFALGAEDLFNVSERSEYVDTIICKLFNLSSIQVFWVLVIQILP